MLIPYPGRYVALPVINYVLNELFQVIPVLNTSPALSATDTAALLGDLEMVRRHWKDAAELTKRFWQDHVDNTQNIEEDISTLQSQMMSPKSP
jgi:hypothetical protein